MLETCHKPILRCSYAHITMQFYLKLDRYVSGTGRSCLGLVVSRVLLAPYILDAFNCFSPPSFLPRTKQA